MEGACVEEARVEEAEEAAVEYLSHVCEASNLKLGSFTIVTICGHACIMRARPVLLW